MSGSAVVRLREKGAFHVMKIESHDISRSNWSPDTDASGPNVIEMKDYTKYVRLVILTQGLWIITPMYTTNWTQHYFSNVLLHCIKQKVEKKLKLHAYTFAC